MTPEHPLPVCSCPRRPQHPCGGIRSPLAGEGLRRGSGCVDVTLLVAGKNAGCDIGYLLFGVREFDSLGITPNEQRLLKLYRMLSESEQMSIEAVALAYAKPDLAAALVAMGNKAEIAAAQQTLPKVSASGSAMAAGGDIINTTTNNKVRKRKGKS